MNTANYHADKQYLKTAINRVPSDDEVFNFSERVAIMILDGKLTEPEARKLAAKNFSKQEHRRN